MLHCTVKSASLLLACCTLTACADTVSPEAGRAVSVSFASAPTSSSASLGSAVGVSRSLTASAGGDVLVIDRVQLVLARIELQRAGAVCDASLPAGDDLVDEHECAELRLAPSLVDLPVDGTVPPAFSVTVPAGNYAALEARIRALRVGSDGGRGSQAFLAAHPELSGVSVIVSGTFNGKAFTYRGAPDVRTGTIFSPALAVDAAPVNFTLHADVTTWFKAQSGALIDPSTANAGGSNVSLVVDNIRRSFRAFRDDDHNGHDDDPSGHS